MMQLKAKLQDVVNDMGDAIPNTDPYGYREAMKNVILDIDAQMLAIERQQIEDGFAEGHARFTNCEESELQEKAEQYYNTAFSK